MRPGTSGSRDVPRLSEHVIADAADRQPGGRRTIDGQLLDIDDAAAQLNVTPRFVRRLVAERRISYLKVGRFIRFYPSDVDHWIEERRVDATE